MTDKPDTMPPLHPSPVEVCDLVLLSREHVQALGWKNREALYPASQAHAYARQHAAAEVAAVAGPLVAEAAKWRDLYRRAINEANGLTNYVEDRPELRRAERNLTAIEAEARAMVLAAPKEPAHG